MAENEENAENLRTEETEPEEEEAPETASGEEREVVIRMEDVYKRFGTNNVLNGMTLDVYRNETLVIIGRSGTGKSVTLKHIVGLLHPDRGNVYVYGKNLARLSRNELSDLREKIGFLFQNGALLGSLSVKDNIALPLREHTDIPDDEIMERVDQKLKIVGLAEFSDTMPEVLSGGMKKRVALARAIIQDPEIILYDEPTHGLDPIMANRINDLILQLKVELNTTSVVVTHDIPSALRVGDRIAMLYNGEIVQSGDPVDFLESGDPVIKQFIYGEDEQVELLENLQGTLKDEI